MEQPLTAVYDANILYPAPIRDLFIRIAQAGLVRAKCTEAIHEGWMRNVLKDKRPAWSAPPSRDNARASAIHPRQQKNSSSPWKIKVLSRRLHDSAGFSTCCEAERRGHIEIEGTRNRCSRTGKNVPRYFCPDNPIDTALSRYDQCKHRRTSLQRLKYWTVVDLCGFVAVVATARLSLQGGLCVKTPDLQRNLSGCNETHLRW